MKKKQNLITWKIEYTCEHDLFNYIDDYNKVLRFTYNRLLEQPKLTTKEITAIQKTMNHKPDTIKSYLMSSIIYDAKAIIEHSDKPIIFGGKDNFIKRCQHKIDKETFIKNRLSPLTSIGEAAQNGNRLFSIQDNSHIIFKPDKHNHFTLNLINMGKNRRKEITQLLTYQNNKSLAITYKIDLRYVYITFDYNKLKQDTYKTKQNRIMAIDMNPDSIGWSVVDYDQHTDGTNGNIVQSGIISLKPLNDLQRSCSVASDSNKSKYFTNKRKHEIIHIAKHLMNLCRHYRCEVFAIEDLNIKHKDLKRGKDNNRLVMNQWCRNLLVNQIRKRVVCSSTIFQEVAPQYSSFIGNLCFRHLNLPDEVLASIEIGRRGFEFCNQYIFNRRPHQKTVIFPSTETVKNQLSISLEEIGIDVPELIDWKKLFSKVKKSKVKYRFSLSDAIHKHYDSLFSKNYKQRYLIIYTFL